MAEYVTKEQVIDWFRPYGHMDESIPYETMVSDLRGMPAADVAPVRHGRWISLTECANEGVYCSICKKKVWKSDYAWCSKKSRNKLRSDYCPNCGAKMEGGADNDCKANEKAADGCRCTEKCGE